MFEGHRAANRLEDLIESLLDVALDLLDACNDPADYHPAKKGFREAVVDAYRTAPGPEVVARTVLRAVQSKRPRRRYAIPSSAQAFTVARRLLPDGAFDWILSRVLRLRRYPLTPTDDARS